MSNSDQILLILKRIEKRDGVVTTEAVVEEARSPVSPLHDQFEWEDTLAAEQWRKQQARLLIRRYMVVIERKEVEEFHNVRVTVLENNEERVARGYVSVERVFNEPLLREQIVQKALAELQTWKKKYETLVELSDIIDSEKLVEIESRFNKGISIQQNAY